MLPRAFLFRRLWAALLVAGLIVAAHPVSAQDAAADGGTDGQGTVRLVDWPDVPLDQLLDEMGRRAPRLLPELDRLTLGYGYTAADSASAWTFDLAWRPGNRVLEKGRVKPWREAPPDVRMVSIEVLADVVVDGRTVAQMIVAVDSMALGPAPDDYVFDVAVSHDRVFLETAPDQARRYLQRGATLDNLVVERIGFASADRLRTGDVRRPREQPRQDPVPPPSVYEPRTSILIGWRLGPDPYYVGTADNDPNPPRSRGRSDGRGRNPAGEADARTPRGEAVDRGRGERDRDGETEPEAPGERRGGDAAADRGDRSGRSGSGKSGASGKESDDDDDEDDTSLAVPALGAAAAVGLAAYAGGTVGIGGTGDSPIGLAAGYTHPGGGIQLQASVNPDVIAQEDGQRLTVKAMGFYDVFASRIQPAVGLGVQADTGEDATVEPAVSAGLVGNLGRFVLYGGYDIVQNTPEVGLAYNFRYQSPDPDEDTLAKR
jgi:hypothetical protein